MKICIVGSSGHYVYALRGIKEDPHAQIVESLLDVKERILKGYILK